MNRDDIIRMALEHFGAVLKSSDLEVKLAALAVTKEREACAEVCEEQADSPALTSLEQYRAKFIADAIRARGKL